jgi:hypothetical protein
MSLDIYFLGSYVFFDAEFEYCVEFLVPQLVIPHRTSLDYF